MTPLTRKIAEGTALITIANIFTTIFNLLSFIIIVRILSRFEYGLIVLALSAVNIASILLDPGISAVIIADVARERGENRFDRAKTLLYRYFQIEFLLGILLFMIIFLSNTYFERRYSETVANLVKIAAFLMIVNAGKNMFLTAFRSHLDFKSIFFFNSGESLFKLVYVILLAYYLRLEVYGVMLAYPLSTATSLLLTLPFYFRIIKNYLSVSRSKESFFFKTMTSHGKWVLGIRGIKQVIANLPPWIIRFLLGVEAVAIFNVARRAVEYAIFLLSPLESVLMPVISQEIKNIRRINKIANKSVKYSIWFSLPIISLSLIFSSFVFNILFGSQYLESAKIFRILIFICLIYALNLTMRPLFFGFRAQKHLFIIYSVGIIIFSFFGTFLTFIFRLYGMALTFIINDFISFLLRYRYIKSRGIKINFEKIIKIDDYDKELINKIKKEIEKKICFWV